MVVIGGTLFAACVAVAIVVVHMRSVRRHRELEAMLALDAATRASLALRRLGAQLSTIGVPLASAVVAAASMTEQMKRIREALDVPHGAVLVDGEVRCPRCGQLYPCRAVA